jgi:type 2A phosphatase activator TIP41
MHWTWWTRQDSPCCRSHTPKNGNRAGRKHRARYSNLASCIDLPRFFSREKTHDGIKEVVKPFDWSYSTDYKGTLSPNARPFEETTKPIPIELLKRPDPILFFDEVVLYEDELADNGIAMLSCKIRVMPERLLLLTRFFMRLDNVLIRLRDTRVYVDFEKKEVIREYQSKECEYEKVRQVRNPRSAQR